MCFREQRNHPPRTGGMRGLMVYGSSGIGKTKIAKRIESLYSTQYVADIGFARTPIILLQASPAPDERLFYQHILVSIGAPNQLLLPPAIILD
ncbi:TniB family NTP-binding protein [Ruegeria atlantica]|uniref:TniB family NTP-binding protein n=1 Tax=Ruegeria atlantica TaxID=81569 RepID=UPI0034A01FA8